MLRSLFPLWLGAALVLAGCATSPPDKGTSTPAAAPAPAATPATPPFIVPASASRRVVLTMTGPKTVTEARDWPAFKKEWQETFAEHAKEAGIGFTFAEADAQQARGQDGTLLQVTVNDYRMIGIGSRIFFGVMTGNAYVDARIRFSNLRDGTAFGEQQHNTATNPAGGVFAKVTPQQVDAIASEAFRPVKAAR